MLPSRSAIRTLPQRSAGTLLVVFALALFGLQGAGAQSLTQSDGPTVQLPAADAELTGLALDAGTATLAAEPLYHPGLAATDTPAGLALWTPLPLPSGTIQATGVGMGTGWIELEGRFSDSFDGGSWTSWQPLGDGARVPSPNERYLQVRALVAGQDARLDRVEISLESGELPSVSMAQDSGNPTVRLWATREGLVGGVTANGHRIVERDRFVAFPSRRALARAGGNEYQVRLSYNGRTATAPVWDVGPWNIKDNYWDAPSERELFKDLPRFVPEAWAAWKDGYNGGRDQFGRWVTFPASIDIADGTFWDDLGMKVSDWVDVTFLWINAPSPPAPATNPKVTFKPAPSSTGTVTKATAATEPPAGQRWYFAEGSTKEPFHTWLLLQNPHPEPVSVTLTYMLLDGATRTQSLLLKPTSRESIFVNQVVPDAEFSTRVDGDKTLFAERAMYFRRDGHVTAGAMRPAQRWCFADGSTRDGSDTWLLLQNPGSEDALVNVGFMLEGGGVVRHSLSLPRTSRRSLYTNLVVPNASFGGCVESDRPIVAERASYGANGGGTGGVIAAAPSLTWYFAEGTTQPGTRTILSLSNPGTEAATAEVSYLAEGTPGKKRSVTVPPMGKIAIDVAADLPGARFGAAITSNKPIVAERTTSFGPELAGRHGGAGAPRLATTWFLAEGSTAQPFQENLLLANPGDTTASVGAEFMRDDGSIVLKTYRVPPGARVTVNANAEVPDAALSIRLRSDIPVVAERSMYWSDMTGGSSAVAVAVEG